MAIPAPPSNLIVDFAFFRGFGISWDASEGATSYQVYGSSTKGGPYDYWTFLNAPVTNWANNLETEYTFYAVVIATNGEGSSEYSDEIEVALGFAEDALTGERDTRIWGMANLAWQNGHMEQSSPGEQQVAVGTWSALLAGKTLEIKVKLKAGETDYIQEFIAAPDLVNFSGIGYVPESGGMIYLANGATPLSDWDVAPAVVGAEAFSTWRIDFIADGSIKYYVDGVLCKTTAAETYDPLTYVNLAVVSYGRGMFNDFGLTATTSGPPDPPTGLEATPGSNEVALAWEVSAGATSYNVYRSEAQGGPYALLNEAETNSYTDGTAINDTTYYYVVTAVNGEGESDYSDEVNATPEAIEVPSDVLALLAFIEALFSLPSGADNPSIASRMQTDGVAMTIARPVTSLASIMAQLLQGGEPS